MKVLRGGKYGHGYLPFSMPNASLKHRICRRFTSSLKPVTESLPCNCTHSDRGLSLNTGFLRFICILAAVSNSIVVHAMTAGGAFYVNPKMKSFLEECSAPDLARLLPH